LQEFCWRYNRCKTTAVHVQYTALGTHEEKAADLQETNAGDFLGTRLQ
jgi:hypothetical protein